MKIAIVTLHRSRLKIEREFYVSTAKLFVERRTGWTVDALDLFLTDDPETSVKLLKNGGYSVTLFRLTYRNKSAVMNLIKELGTACGTIGVWGHDSFSFPEEYLKKGVDFIISDEPELSLYEVAAAIDSGENPGSASGVIYRDDKQKTYLYGEHRVLPEMDLIPSPYLSGEIEINPSVHVFWEIARGCLFKCDFCVEFSHNSTLRYHSFDYLEQELELFALKGVRQITLGAPIANLSHQHMRKIFDLIRKYLPDALVEMQVRADILTSEEIAFLSEMNVYLYLGVQSFHQKVLENMLTSINVEKTLAVIRAMNNYPSLSFGIDIIGGLPKMSYQDFMEDLEQAFYLWPIHISVYRLSLYPGTRMHNRIRELGYTVESHYPYNALASEQITKREMERISEIAEAVDLLYNRGRMVAIFTIIAEALGHKAGEVLERWVKWARKQKFEYNDDTPFEDIYPSIEQFFQYMFERFQKKKLWVLANDLLRHNYHYTQSLATPEEDIQTLPYLLDTINGSTKIGINKSARIDRYSFNIEDVTDAGYITIKGYTEEMEKEPSYAVVYRLDDGVFTRTLTDTEGNLFRFLASQDHSITVSDIVKKFSSADIITLIQDWCDEGVLFIDTAD